MDTGSPIERFPEGDDMDELLESKLPWRSDYTPKPAPRYVPEYVRDPTTRHSPSPSVPEDPTSSEDLENEMSLLELEESRLNPPVPGFNACFDSHFADVGILPIIYHTFKET